MNTNTETFHKMAATRQPTLVGYRPDDLDPDVECWEIEDDLPFVVIMQDTTPPITEHSLSVYLCADVDDVIDLAEYPSQRLERVYPPAFIEAWDLRTGLVFRPLEAREAA